ncbi:ABC transporter substrate-binding protein [Corynebacterium mayonis]|uniref:ABC transporter substrate-binding protein n=1 Tax=Corynebacterium mayonis TaxID=3062461 RepID=UPI0031404780
MKKMRAIGAIVGAGLVLSSCSESARPASDDSSRDHFGYELPVNVTTTNAGTLVGSTELAQMLSGRLYPGVFVPGPSGQMIPNTDLVTTQVLPGAQRRVIYKLSADAHFSDGTPVTCTDYLLASTAGTMPEIFGSHMPLFKEVDEVVCEPGAKEFTVIFETGGGGLWRGLFEAGTVVPAHVVARKAGVEPSQLVEALSSRDPVALQPIAEAWRNGFNLDGFDPAMHVSFGPYRIETVGESGEVTLVTNDSYYGDPPRTPKLVVWPDSTDSEQLVKEGALRIADLSQPHPQWLDLNAEDNPFDVERVAGDLTDTLTFAPAGVWSYPLNRQALAACIDPSAAARASSEASGVDVPPHLVHVVSANDVLAGKFADIVDRHATVDTNLASALAGMEVRVGYLGSSPHYPAMVEALRVSCEPAGVKIVDAGAGKTLGDLPHVQLGEWGQETVTEGSIDLLLHPVDPGTQYSGGGARAQDVPALREREGKLWEELSSFPLAAQPRNFAVDRHVGNVSVYTGSAGLGWNMDRWQIAAPQPSSTTEN